MRPEKNIFRIKCTRSLLNPSKRIYVRKKKIQDCLDPRKTKMIIKFSDRESASIKSFAV